MRFGGDQPYDPSRVDAPLQARRQNAREAFDDVWGGAGRLGSETWPERLQRAREEAIETATRVQVDEDVTAAAEAAVGPLGLEPAEVRVMLAAAFRAAGFEIEE